jgi:prepilin-type N-terminal cleavage/methylation domain-containing protein
MPRRAGFTLLEMVVVLTIVLTLTALTVAVIRPWREDRPLTVAANQVQGWLVAARQYALRDRVPSGVRLLPAAAGDPRLVTTLQFVQQPDSVGGGKVSVAEPPGSVVDFQGFDLFGGAGPDDPGRWPVQPGDYLELRGGPVHRIESILSASRLAVAPPSLPFAFPPTADYRILRSARPIVGLPPLPLPRGVVIDLGVPYPPYGGRQDPPVDILFTPAGGLQGRGAVTDKVILWLRDGERPARPGGQTFAGPQALVAVYAASGLIAVHPVDDTPDPVDPNRYGHPYRFTQDGRSSGL